MENPWSEPSLPLALHSSKHPSIAPPDPSRLLLEADEEDTGPAWGAESPRDDAVKSDSDRGFEGDKAGGKGERGEGGRLIEEAVGDQETVPEAEDDEPAHAPAQPSTSPRAQSAPPENAPPPAPEPRAASPIFPLNPAVPAATDAPPMDDFDAPPMDDFPAVDDDGFGSAAHEGGDDFADFGEVGKVDEEDDFGEFGDFGDAAPLDESAFDTPAPASPQPAPSPALSRQPTLATFPPLRLDLSDTSRRAIAPQLQEFFRDAWPSAAQAVNDEPERQVEGAAQVLVTESSRNLLADLSQLPALKPLDWRRSRVRREHLGSMGVAVPPEDTADLRVSTLGASSSYGASIVSPARPSSAPPGGTGALPLSSPNPNSRSSTPYGTSRQSSSRANLIAPAPTMNCERADELMGIKEDDLTLMSLAKLHEMNEELDRISVEASGVLTHALMMREKEGQDKEVYNGMIQDLVIAAAKMKTSSSLSSSAGQAPKRSGSGRWKLSSSVK
ncbi:hypothetical protein Rt10032_c18g6083 [Rhodotorula toruloides]|uniref:Uncharacterized protein n=1 Tax=Rhodotorula toruloides TaxID=5286 RepID=A0A511KQA9_RHOTO|nr:hypothetical protein Rt10032_c18g6083 [Rhodotorula toruloides]